MKRHLAFTLVLLLLFSSILTGCSPSGDTDVPAKDNPEIISDTTPIMDVHAETDEASQLALGSSDDGYMSLLGSPFYISTTFTDRLSDQSYLNQRRALIDALLDDSALINTLAPEVEQGLIEHQNNLFGLFDSFIAADLELPYIYTASNRYADLLMQESLAEAQLQSLNFDEYDSLEGGWMAYQHTLFSLERGTRLIDRIEWIIEDGANLKTAADIYQQPELSASIAAFEEGLTNADEDFQKSLEDLINVTLRLHDDLERLKLSDEYMSLSAIKFMQAQIPAMKQSISLLSPNDFLSADEIDAMSAFVDTLEGYAYGSELLYLEDSKYNLALDQDIWLAHIQNDNTGGLESLIPVAYAENDQENMAKSTAYRDKAQATLTQKPSDNKASRGWLGSIWNAAKTVARGTRQTVGAVLDTSAATYKSVLDVGFGVANGNSAKDILDTIADNAKQVSDNFKKGTSGSMIMSDAKSMVEAVEGLPGQIAKATLGDNMVTSALDNTSKFITGIGTSFAKGVFDLANAKSTNAQLANATFDVAASFVSFTKVAKFVGKPFVKLSAAAAKSTGSLLKGISASAQNGLKVLATKGANLLSKGPKIFDAAQKTSIRQSISSLGSTLFSNAVNLSSKLGTVIKNKTSALKSSLKTLSQTALDKVKSTSIGSKVVNKLSQWGDDFAKILKEKAGSTVDEFAQNYAETEGWNLMKEVNLTIETLYDSAQAQMNRDASKKLMEAKKSSTLPTRDEIKTAEDEIVKDSDQAENQMPDSSENSNSQNEQASTQSDNTSSSSTDSAVAPESTQPASDADNKIDDSAQGQSDTNSEPSGATENGSQFVGQFTGYANQILFYDAGDGEVSFPIGPDHSYYAMTIFEDGSVNTVLTIYGTDMFDFDIEIDSTSPAELSGDKLTYRYTDSSGATTTVSGTISTSTYTGTIGVYSEKNERIGHISFYATK